MYNLRPQITLSKRCICSEKHGITTDIRSKYRTYNDTTQSISPMMETEALPRSLDDKIRRYPLRNVKRPNYCELDDDDDDCSRISIRRRRSVCMPKAENITNRKNFIRRRYSESDIVNLEREKELLDDPDFYPPSHKTSKKEDEPKAVCDDSVNLCPVCHKPMQGFESPETQKSPNHDNEPKTDDQEVIHKIVLKRIYHKNSCSERLYVVSGSDKLCETNETRESCKKKVDKINQDKNRASTTTSLKVQNILPESNKNKPENRASTDNMTKSTGKNRVNEVKLPKISRKRKSDSEAIHTYQNKEENLSEYSEPKKRSPKKQVINDISDKKTEKDETRTLSNYEKYEQLYLTNNKVREKRDDSNSKNIPYRRKSTSCISYQSTKIKLKEDKQINSEQNACKEKLLVAGTNKISYRRKSDSVREIVCQEKLSVEPTTPKPHSISKKDLTSSKQKGSTQLSVNTEIDKNSYRKKSCERSRDPDKQIERIERPSLKLNSLKSPSKNKAADSTSQKKTVPYQQLNDDQEINKESEECKQKVLVGTEPKKISYERKSTSANEIGTLEKPLKSPLKHVNSDMNVDSPALDNSENKMCPQQNYTPNFKNKEVSTKPRIFDDPNFLKDVIVKYKGKDSARNISITYSYPKNLLCKNHSETVKGKENSQKPSIVEKGNSAYLKKGTENRTPEKLSTINTQDSQLNIELKQKPLKTKSESETNESINKGSINSKKYPKNDNSSINKRNKSSERDASPKKALEENMVKLESIKDNNNNVEGQALNSSEKKVSGDRKSSNKEVVHLSNRIDKQKKLPQDRVNEIPNESVLVNSQSKEKPQQEPHRKERHTLSPIKAIIRDRSENAPSKLDSNVADIPPCEGEEDVCQCNRLRTPKPVVKRAKSPTKEPKDIKKPRQKNVTEKSRFDELNIIRPHSEPSFPTSTDNEAFLGTRRASAVPPEFLSDSEQQSLSLEGADHGSNNVRKKPVDSLSLETLLRRMFTDERETEESRKELLKILASSSEESSGESDNSPNRCVTPSIDERVHENSPTQQNKDSTNIIITITSPKESNNSSTQPKDHVIEEEPPANAQPKNMTKMEHYKKRLIHQHEKPLLQSSSNPTTEEEDERSSTSPISSSSGGQSNQNSLQEKKKEDTVQCKVAKKRAVSRKQFRHQNLELFKLGTSIPTSLCKTKEPYNICAEKNLQMCCQTQQNGKKDENPISITDAIINSMEGSKKRDTVLWRSMSLNHERTEKPVVSNNNNNLRPENNKNIGRHILPAIVPEIPERRKNKLSPTPNKEGEGKNGYNVNVRTDKSSVIQKAEPVSINKRKYITQRRKTVIGIENSDTNGEYTETIGSRSDSYRQETETTPLPRRRNSLIELDMSQSSPINLSVSRTVHENGTDRANVIVNNPYNDPRLNPTVKYRNHYRKQSVPRQVNALQRNVPTVPLQNQIPANYPTVDPRNNVYLQRDNFPEIQQQMVRMENPTVNHNSLRQEPQHQYPPNVPVDNNEEVIKTIIQLVKSSMDPDFTIEILMILNKWYIELKTYWAQPNISRHLKTSITRTLNEVLSYISDEIFGLPSSAKLKSYAEEMMQLQLVEHKDLLIRLLPLLSRNCHNQPWMCNFIKLLSHPPTKLPAEPLTNRRIVNRPQMRPKNITANQPGPSNEMYGLQQGAHFVSPPPPHLQQRFFQPQEQFFTNQPNIRPPPPYDGFHYKDNSLANSAVGTYLANAEQHRANELIDMRNRYMEVQMQNTQFQELHPNAQMNYPRAEHCSVPPPSVPVRNDSLCLADNRFVPPKFGPQTNLNILNGEKFDANNRPGNIANKLPVPPTNLVASNNVPHNETTALPAHNHSHINIQSVDIIQSSTESMPKVPNGPGPSREITRRDSEASTSGSNTSDHCAAPDVEELLHTNVIFNKSLTTAADNPKDDPEDHNMTKANSTDEDNVMSNASESNHEDTVDELAASLAQVINCNSTNNSRSIPSTVIVQDNSMEITRGNSNRNIVEVVVDRQEHNSNEVIVERIRYITRRENGSSTVTVTKGDVIGEIDLNVNILKLAEVLKNCRHRNDTTVVVKDLTNNKYTFFDGMLKFEFEDKKEIITIDDDEDESEVSVEEGVEMPRPQEALPKLIKLPPQENNALNEKQQNDRQKNNLTPTKRKSSEIIIIDDEKDGSSKAPKISDKAKNSDCNQNYITENNEMLTDNSDPIMVIPDAAQPSSSNNTAPSTPENVVHHADSIIEISDSPATDQLVQNEQPAPNVNPIIEDISDEEEPLKPFIVCSTYDNKIRGDPRKILQSSEVSHCTLIEGNLKYMKETVNSRFQDKRLVYTKPVTPQHLRRYSEESEKSSTSHTNTVQQPPTDLTKRSSRLLNIAQFKEDHSSLTCQVNIRRTPELGYSSPSVLEGSFPRASPFADDIRYPKASPVVSARFTSNIKPLNGVIPTSPMPVRQIVPSPQAVPVSPQIPDNSNPNWKNWITDEQRRGFFNFARSLSTESTSTNGRQSIETTSSAGDQCTNYPIDSNYHEIKIDSKHFTIKKSVYERIPKGKLCYVRETNTFVRYFDDNQMELFIRNLNINEGSLAASDLLKQIKSRADCLSEIEVSLGPQEGASKSEVISLAKDVRFSEEDNLSDPESYIEEVEKVERHVPKDFYGFYKFVTGYQIVNNHPPISFQTFLTMHNTNGLRGLFKNYINTLIEGKNIL